MKWGYCETCYPRYSSRKYNRVASFRHRLSHYGVPSKISRFLAVTMAMPASCCDICGISHAEIDRALRRKICLPGGIWQHWRSLHLDHIDPSVDRANPENIRLLCYHCNNARQRARYSDEEILLRASRLWRKIFGERVPWVAPRKRMGGCSGSPDIQLTLEEDKASPLTV